MHKFASIVLLLFIISVVLTGCSGAKSGVTAKLEPGPTAPLGGTIPFRLTVSYVRDAPSNFGETGAELVISLSRGLTLLSPNWSQKSVDQQYIVYTSPITFQANVPQTVDFEVQLNEPGTQRIYSGAAVYLGSGERGGGDTKLLDVTSTGTTIRDSPLAWPTAIATCPQPAHEGRDSDLPPCPEPTAAQ